MGVRATFRSMRELTDALLSRLELLVLPLLSVVLLGVGFLGGWTGWQSDVGKIGWLATGASLAVELSLALVLSFVHAMIATMLSVAFARGLLAGATLRIALSFARTRIVPIAQFAGASLAVSIAGFLADEWAGDGGPVLRNALSFAVTVLFFYMSPVLAMERRTIGRSVGRSVDLVRRSAGTIVLSGLVLGVVVAVVAIAIGSAVIAAFGSMPSRDDGLSGGEALLLAVAAPVLFAGLVILDLWTLALYRLITTTRTRFATPQHRNPARAARNRRQ